MNRHWPHGLIAAGALIALSGFVYDVLFAGIPYQDPTAELAARYEYHAWIASAILRCGICVFLIGAVAGVVFRIAGKPKAALHG